MRNDSERFERRRARLLAGDPAQRRLAAANGPSPAFVLFLLERSRDLRFADRIESARTAELAAALATQCPADLRALALAAHGNGLRMLAQLREADSVFASAVCVAEEADEETRSEVASLLASLRIRQARWQEAAFLLNEVVSLRQRAGGAPLAAALVSLATAKSDAGDSIGALRTVTRALPHLPHDDPALRLAAHHNAAEFQAEIGLAEAALRGLPRFEHLYATAPAAAPKRHHLKAHIYQALGLRPAAEDELRRTADLYLDTGQEDLLAIARLELAAYLLADLGRAGEARSLAALALPRLRVLGIGEDAPEARRLRRALAARLTAANALLVSRWLNRRAS